MPTPTDMIVPMLQKMQADLSHVRLKVDSLDARVGNVERQLEAFGPYITYTVGLHAQDRVDIDRHEQEISEIKQRLKTLEDTKA